MFFICGFQFLTSSICEYITSSIHKYQESKKGAVGEGGVDSVELEGEEQQAMGAMKGKTGGQAVSLDSGGEK